MRKEPFTVGDYVHVYNRGNRKQEIVCDSKDQWHFLQMLYYFNTEKTPENPFRDLRDKLKSNFNSKLVWPAEWPIRKPIVKILAFVLLPNHFHLLLKEIRKGGITLFMRRFGTGMTNRFNTKYQESGRLFQGSYKAKCIDKDTYFEHISVYIQVKNVFELYPGGLDKALKEFDRAFEWAIKYPYCSLGDYAGERKSSIIEKDLLGDIFPTQELYKEFASDSLLDPDIDLEEKFGFVEV